MNDLEKDFEDGVLLINLLEILSNKSVWVSTVRSLSKKTVLYMKYKGARSALIFMRARKN